MKIHIFLACTWLICSKALLAQETIPNLQKDSIIGEGYIAVKAINLRSFIWDLGTIDYSFDGVVKHVYSSNLPNNLILQSFKLNDTIRNISFQGDSKDSLVENQMYNACLSFIYVKKGERVNLPHSDLPLFYPMVIPKLCKDLIECTFIEKKDTLENGKKLVVSTTQYKKYSSEEQKYLPDLYSDSGYSISTYTINTGKKNYAVRQTDIFFQSGKLASRVKKRNQVETKSVWDETGKKVEHSRSTFEGPNRKRGFETKGTKYTWYFRKNGRICFKREVTYNYSGGI